MSDSNDVSTASSAQQSMVPKERLDELIADRRMLQEQIQTLQHIARSAVPQRQSAPQEDPPHLKQLREENPAAYQAFKEQEFRAKQQSAAMFTVLDNQDRLQFMQEFGEEGKKHLQQVESELERLRSQGISNYNRGQILVHLKGQEALSAARTPKPAQAPAQAPNIPSSDPSVAGTTAGGSAQAAPTGKKTIEDYERELADVVF